MKSNKINEGNIYDMQDTFGANKDATKTGLNRWNAEMRRQLMEYLKRSKVLNPELVIKTTIGEN